MRYSLSQVSSRQFVELSSASIVVVVVVVVVVVAIIRDKRRLKSQKNRLTYKPHKTPTGPLSSSLGVDNQIEILGTLYWKPNHHKLIPGGMALSPRFTTNKSPAECHFR